MKKLFWFFLILCNAAFAGGSNPGLYYGQVPTAAQWNSYFSSKLDYTPGPASTIPYWDGSGNQVNALISGDCTSAYNIFSCKATSLDGGALGAIPYQTGANSTAFLSGNISTTPEFVTSTGTGTLAQAPSLTSSTGSGSVVLNTSPTITSPTITGGSINNTPIGQSTAAAGTFTSLASVGSSFSASAPAGSLTQYGTTGDLGVKTTSDNLLDAFQVNGSASISGGALSSRSPGTGYVNVGGLGMFATSNDDGWGIGWNSISDDGHLGWNYFNVNGTESVNITGRASWDIQMGNGAGTPAFNIRYRATSAAVNAFTTFFGLSSSGAAYFAGTISMGVYSVAGLPTCGATYVNHYATVSDASVTPTYWGTATGGGTISAPVFCTYNGTTYTWVYH